MRRLILSAVVLNGLFLVLKIPYPTLPWVAAEALLLTGLFAIWPTGTGRRLLAYAVGLFYGVLLVTAAGEALMQQSLGRSLNIYLDAGLLDSVYNLLTTNLDGGLALGVAVLAVAFLAGLAALVASLLLRLRSTTQAQAGVSAVLLGIGILALLLSPALRLPVGITALDMVRQQLSLALATRAATAEFEARVSSAAAGIDQNPDSRLDLLENTDVVVGFIESYGISALTDPRYAPLIGDRLDTMQQALDKAGLHVATGRLRSPVQGGQSWLAHATFLSGQWVDSQLDYEVLLASDYPTLIDDFNDSGHVTVAVMPAITRDWPEGRQFGYDRIYVSDTMGYQGPALNWVTMPDQYTWSWFQRGVREKIDAPLFAELALISSHAPWVPVLPVLQNWDGIGSGKVFNLWKNSGEAPDSLWLDHDRVRDHYVRSIDYALQVVTEYAIRYVNDSTLLVILGDHQPAPLVTGKNASRDVPVHVISGDPALVARFVNGPGYAASAALATSPSLSGVPSTDMAAHPVASSKAPVTASPAERSASGLATFRLGTRPAPAGESADMDEFRHFLLRRFTTATEDDIP